MAIKNGPYEYTGEVVSVGERQEFGTNGFAKREFMVCPDQSAEYPSFLQFTLKAGKKEDKTGLVSKNDIGRTVKVTFFVETRKWTSKATGKTGFSTEATAFKLEWSDSQSMAPDPAEPEADMGAGDPEDMPF